MSGEEGRKAKWVGESSTPVAAGRLEPQVEASNTIEVPKIVEAVLQQWVRDAELVGDKPRGGWLLAGAGEIAEHALGDQERARGLYEASARHNDRDPRAFAGLRRIAREFQEAGVVDEVYQQQSETTPDPSHALVAACQWAIRALRRGEDMRTIERVLRHFEPQLANVSPELQALWQATMEDFYFADGQPAVALQTRVIRWEHHSDRTQGRDREWLTRSALAIAGASEAVGADPQGVLNWHKLAFQLSGDRRPLRTLLRDRYDAEDYEGVANLLMDAVEYEDDANLRNRYLYELGLIRSRKLEDRPAGLEALSSSCRGGTGASLAATTYLAEVRRHQGFVGTEDFTDAVITTLDFCAGGVERADALTFHAYFLMADFGLSDRARQVAEEALLEAPGYVPAIKLLSSLYASEGRWHDLVRLGEDQLDEGITGQDRVRVHEQLARLNADTLLNHDAAERHLREALEFQHSGSLVRRLEAILRAQDRWGDLFDLVQESAHSAPSRFERASLMQRAAEVAEENLGNPRLAAEIFRELFIFAPDYGSTYGSLSRLLEDLHEWEELLEVNRKELELLAGDTPSRQQILLHSADVAYRMLGDSDAAEAFYRQALDEDPRCTEALRGLGQILNSSERWSELALMTMGEYEAAESPDDKARCLASLGEIYLNRLVDLDAAAGVYEQLIEEGAITRSASLLQLDRIYQAQDLPQERLRILLARLHDADDSQTRSRLSFQIAELYEWGVGSPQEASGYYLAAMHDETATAYALSGLDRLWGSAGIDADFREYIALELLAFARESQGATRDMVLEMLVERAGEVLGSASRDDCMAELADRLPLDVYAAERWAVRLLQRGDLRSAEAARSLAPSDPVQVARTQLAAIEDGLPRDGLPLPVPEATPWLEQFLALETGSTDSDFDGCTERETWRRIRERRLTFGELQKSDDTEAGTRLSVEASRMLGDLSTLQISGELLAHSLVSPERKMRAWLDLAEVEVANRQERIRWLKEAASQQCFRQDLRDELYEKMTSLSDFEGLEVALQAQLATGGGSPEFRAGMACRRGQALDILGRRMEAAEAFEEACRLDPLNSDIALEKSRLEQLMDRLDEARNTLESCLVAGIGGDGRIDVLNRIADLHLMHGGENQRALEALEEVCQLRPDAPEWGFRLASVHARFGDAMRSADILNSLLSEPPKVEELPHWNVLVNLLWKRLSDKEGAAEILWMLFRHFPARRTTQQWLEDFYKATGGAQELADGIGNLLATGEMDVPETLAARLWDYVGELNLSVLERPSEAENAFRKARELGDHSPAGILRLAKSIARQPGRTAEAVPMISEALEGGDNLGIWEDAYAQLEGLFEQLHLHSHLRVARQVRIALGANVPSLEDNVRRDPGRELPAELGWTHLADDLFESKEREVLRTVAPLAEKVLRGSRQPSRGVLMGRRGAARGDAAGFEVYLETACRWLGIEAPAVFLAEGERGAGVSGVGQAWVSADRLDAQRPLRARFWAGWIAGLLFSDLGPYTWVDDVHTYEMFRALGAHGHERGTDGGTIAGLLLFSQRRAAVNAMEGYPEFLVESKPNWSLRARQLADRAGLMMCGDLRVAVEEILFASNWDLPIENMNTREQILAEPRLRSLLLYAISDAHFLLRYESGLAERPHLFA